MYLHLYKSQARHALEEKNRNSRMSMENIMVNERNALLQIERLNSAKTTGYARVY